MRSVLASLTSATLVVAFSFVAKGQEVPEQDLPEREVLVQDSTTAEKAQRTTESAAAAVATVGHGKISFQGYAELSGVPYTGSLEVGFRIFNVASGGTHLWDELQVVVADSGVFNAELGTNNSLNIPFDEPYWLALKLGGDPWMTDRVKLLESPYAFTSAALQGNPVSTSAPSAGNVLVWDGSAWTPGAAATASPWTDSGGNIYRSTGDIAIGSTNFKGKVNVRHNSSLSDPQLLLDENGNDYARINFENNNGTNYWTIAAYIASNHRNDRLNFWNGTGGDVMTITGDGEVGIGVGISPKTPLHIGNGRRVLFGIDTLGNGDKLMFLPDLHAFRVGTVSTGAASTYWNRDSLGLYSFASGLNTRAQGYGATAMGRDTEATNSYAMATGFFTNADGQYSTAMGFNTDAFAIGSTALGYSTDATGYYSTSLGQYTLAQAYAGTAVGRYNVGGGSATQWIGTDPIFEIGIGTSTAARANAITVRKNGNVGIGTTFPASTLQVIGTTRLGSAEEITDGGAFILDFDAVLRPTSNNGRSLGNSSKRWSVVYATNGTINTSDRRLKEDIQPLDPALDKVMRLRPVSFKWNSGVDRRQKYGLVAQDVMNVIPEAVETTEMVQDEESGVVTEVPVEYLGINYSKVIPFLIKAIQDQQETIETLTNRVQALESN